jgi:hypothetical protein
MFFSSFKSIVAKTAEVGTYICKSLFRQVFKRSRAVPRKMPYMRWAADPGFDTDAMGGFEAAIKGRTKLQQPMGYRKGFNSNRQRFTPSWSGLSVSTTEKALRPLKDNQQRLKTSLLKMAPSTKMHGRETTVPRY